MNDVPEAFRKVSETVHRTASKHSLFVRFNAGDSLIDGGMASLAMVDLVFALEAEFDLIIPDHEMTAANFTSIGSITKMIAPLLVADVRWTFDHQQDVETAADMPL